MKKVLPGRAVTLFDRKNIENGHHLSSDLICGAAGAMLSAIREKVHGLRILVIAGKGNNGSDGIELALLLRKEGEDVSLLLRGDAANEENAERRAEAIVLGIPAVDGIEGYDCYIDALYGSSFHPPLREDDEALLESVNRENGLRIACDVPSGNVFDADMTVTFTFYKTEMFAPGFRDRSGEIILADPGFTEEEKRKEPSDTFLLEPSDYERRVLEPSTFKNRRGHLLICGGSECYSGAPRISARAAFHSGAGLVTIKTSREGYEGVSRYESAIVTAGPVDWDRFDAALFGPGWGDDAERSFITFPKNFVIDASALDMIEKGDDFSFRAVVTPHMGEFRRICNKLEIVHDPRLLAETIRAVVVLKGENTFITDGNNMYILDERNGALGVAGSGDALAGIIASFLAEGRSPLDAAISGVLLHSKAGKAARDKWGAFDSVELTDEIGRAL